VTAAPPSETENLIGKAIRVFVDEGSPPLTDGMRLAGRIARLGPETGPYRHYGIVVELTDPSSLRNHTIFVTPRYQGYPLPVPLPDGNIIVNVQLYTPSRERVAGGIGELEILPS